MTFEDYHKQHPQYSYLVAKIHYNVAMDNASSSSSASSLLADLVVQFSAPSGDVCESCSA